MTKRAKLITALVAAIGLVVVTPLAAVAYWVVTAQLAVTAQASTFSIAPYAVAPASASSSSTFAGWKTTQYYTAPLANNGTTPWAGQTVALSAGTGFGPAAVANAQVAFKADAAVCQNDATYTGVTPKSVLSASTWSSSAAVAPGARVYACIKLDIADTDTRTQSGQAAPAQTLRLTTTASAAQNNWTADEQSALTLSSTGWAACSTTGNSAVLTAPVPVPPGVYTATRADTGATFFVTASPNGKSVSVSNPTILIGDTAETYVTIKNAQGTVIAYANVIFRSPLFNKSVVCA
ncbi:hypothetical protein [Microbacterium sp. HJ5]